MLLDSNIIIYAAQRENRALRGYIAQHSPAVSAVSYVEVLGYHRLTSRERRYYELFFAAAPMLSISDAVIEQAVELRQLRKLTLGDALIAATAIIHGLPLVTHNTKDFEQISGLTLFDPLTPI